MAGPLTPAEITQAQALEAKLRSGGLALPGMGAPPPAVAGPPPPLPPPAMAPAGPPVPEPSFGATKIGEALNSKGLFVPGLTGVKQTVADPSLPKPAAPEFAAPASDTRQDQSQPMQLQMPAMAKPTYVPGGWTPHSRTGKFEPSGDTRGVVESGFENEKQANETATSVQAQAANDVYGALNDQQVGIEMAEAERLRRESDRQQVGRDAVGRLQDLTREVNDASNIDPGRLWNDKGTLAKVVGAIGVALGGFVAARTGGPNTAMEAIDRAIDRDIDAQKARLSAARGKLSEQRGIIGAMREQFGDERTADAAARHIYLDNAGMQVRKIIAGSQSKEIQARGQAMLADIDKRLGLYRTQVEKEAQGQLTERYRPGGYVGGAASGSASTVDSKLYVPTGGDGKGYVARTEKEAVEGRALQDARQNLVPLLEKLKAKRGSTNWAERGLRGVYETEDVAELKSLQAQATLQLKNLEQAGALDKGMQEIAGQILGDWTSMQGHPEKAADSLIGAINNKITSHERAQAAQGAQQSVAVDAQGNATPIIQGQTTTAGPRAEMPAGFAPVGGNAQPTYMSPQKQGKVVQLSPEQLAALQKSTAKRGRK